MTERFRNKYRSATTRLYGYDYSRSGTYFVTICTKKHICYFGNIIVETGLRPVCAENVINPDNPTASIKLTEEGKIVESCWYDLPNHYSNIILDEFLIMPNHVHGIIIIAKLSGESQTHGLSEFIRAFKSFSSRRINELHRSIVSATWQPRYYDHLIRSDNELDRIRMYIRNNPRNWFDDEHYVKSVP